MGKTKKVDLSSELVDLLMEDDSASDTESTGRSTQVLQGEATRAKAQDSDPDPTIAIPKSTETPAHPAKKESTAFGEPSAVKELSGIFKPAATPTKIPRRTSSELVLTSEGALVQSEQLRIAQERILELEQVVDTLRIENEELVAAGEALKNRADDLKSQVEQVKYTSKEKNEIFNEELVVLRSSASAKNDEISRMRLKIEELETRLQGDLKRIRVRERELENRLEIVKLESHAVLKNKDDLILDLKRKIDQMGFELENYRNKSRELNKFIEENRERVRRTVKALRLALTMLEGDDAEVTPLKKAE